ncbi:MAG: hypothetical protein H7833_08420 [Magnetococcus sp. DMHC-1]|nr:hypothetical protein [Magnetococcales bacterium]
MTINTDVLIICSGGINVELANAGLLKSKRCRRPDAIAVRDNSTPR